MTTIGLAMLVRDEEDNVRAAIEQTLPIVEHITVIDTGSKDRTRSIVRSILKDTPGRLITRKWHGFGKARTQLLDLARGHSDYTLMLDADHLLHVDGDRPELEADEYLLRINDSWGGRLPLLTKSDHPFEYRGAAHCYLHSDQPARRENLDWLSVDGGPGATPEKLERDLALLEQALVDDPSNTRTLFYLAQTYRDLDMHEKAIQVYLLRSNMPWGFDEERYFARYQAGVLLGEHVGCFAAFEQLIAAYRDRPTRAEALRALANLANSIADKISLPDDTLFVSPHAYKEAV